MNLLKFPIVSFFIFYTSLNNMAAIFRPSLVRLNSFSGFALFSVSIVVILQQAVLASIYILFFIKRHAIAKFMNNAVKICPTGKYLQKFKSSCIHNSFILATVFFVTEVVQYFGAFNVNIATFFLVLVYSYPVVMLFAFASFTKAAESFIGANMKEFRNSVAKEVRSTDKQHSKRCENLSVKYKEIHDLSIQFNETFGLIITSFVTLGSSLTVFNVIYCDEKCNLLIKLFPGLQCHPVYDKNQQHCNYHLGNVFNCHNDWIDYFTRNLRESF